jgi:hypothetical protein
MALEESERAHLLLAAIEVAPAVAVNTPLAFKIDADGTPGEI